MHGCSAKRRPFYLCSLRCICHSCKLRLEQSPRQHASQHGGRMTRPTGMDLVDHIMVTVHGRGYHQQCTASADLHPPHISPFYLHMVWIPPHDHCHSTLQLSTVEPTSPPALPFSRKTPQEETLHEVSFAGKACIKTQSTQCIHPTITRGAPLPPPVGYLSLQSWLSNRVVAFCLHSKTTTSSHAPTNCISVQEGVFQPSNDAF